MRRWIEKIVPRYAWGPLVLAVAVNMAVYEGVALFKDHLTFYSLELPIDRMLPFVAPFIVFYLLAFVQWVINYVLIARENKAFCYRFVYGDVISKLFCLLFFVLFPTTMERPDVVGTGRFDWLVKFIYHMDAPVNLFPSIHCLESWCCIHAAFAMKKVPNWYKGVTVVMSLGVFASTLLVKQHVLLDMFGGIVVFEAGLFISGWITKKMS